ncbi:5-histidylcysteine sulfoxide synthase [Acidithiobacillus ferriphilus]|uniref:5-histidylcysteine sulfoxide synthase n=1 Tax=Acidithiobacillus ferriphilus TaxID=1689834 RepID=UPI002331236B|nr:5-histidylcysteine sulfoxide synthase [Acidithiobacillus ferriphilus]WCE93580.1 5-histidylcysteine sulfoxide synthase [Acidithiobacillus ferriphilus]
MARTRIAALRLDGEHAEQKREEIRRIFHETFSLYEQLFDHLAEPAAWYEKAIPLRHPLIFYFGHSATFYVNKLQVAGLIGQHLDPRLESVFAVGVDEMSWDDLDETHYDWPSVDDVRQYRQRVRELVDGLIREMPLSLPITWDSPWWVILMGIEHENIHLETSSVLMRQLPLSRVRPVEAFHSWTPAGAAPDNILQAVAGGTVRLGKERADPRYGWDNEYGLHQAALQPFHASRFLVSNQEFLAFVEQDGYSESRWWTAEGDRWRRFSQARHPTFWVPDQGTWRLRLIAEERPLPWSWPVEVNALEADAFCRWKSARTGQNLRLPSEDEWRRLRDFCVLADSDAWDDAVPGNIGLAAGCSPCPVDQFKQGDFYDVVGNVWQWTATPIYPFPGFEVHPLYDDFTVPTFDQQHNLIKGGSFISLGNETQQEARYAFRRHFFQHAGFRYVASPNALPEIPVYESDALVSQYAEFHYGREYYGVANFAAKVVGIAVEAMAGRPLRRALDIGCAVGRGSFELAKHCPEVTGLDFSARFISVGVQLRERGHFSYTLTEEGELQSYQTADLATLGLTGTADRVHFFQADACNLKPLYRDYDLVVAANLIDRLHHPRKFLEDIADRILPGGLLVITSPYTWLEEHTARTEWLGGFKRDGENLSTFDALREILSGAFRLRDDSPQDLSFVIRETARKYQHSIAQVTIWERL